MKLRDWAEFKTRLTEYAVLTSERRRQLIFRGHSSADWKLETTLDRVRRFSNDDVRNQLLTELLREFRHEALGLTRRWRGPLADLHWEYVARHHGLPTRIMDWTESPYIAAYFAFEQARQSGGEVTIWVLDRDRFQQASLDAIEILETDEVQQYNTRAFEQRSVMLRVDTIEATVESLLGSALNRFDIPATERSTALSDLDEMKINARSLFRDLDAAARTAERRVLS